MLADPDQSSLHSATFRKVMQLLEGLRKTKSGGAVYSHIGQMLEAYESDQLKTEQTLCTLLRQLLDAYSMHLPRESSLYTQIKLLQVRLTPPLAASEVTALRTYMRANINSGQQSKDLTPKEVESALSPLLDAFGVLSPQQRKKQERREVSRESGDRTQVAPPTRQAPITHIQKKRDQMNESSSSRYQRRERDMDHYQRSSDRDSPELGRGAYQGRTQYEPVDAFEARTYERREDPYRRERRTAERDRSAERDKEGDRSFLSKKEISDSLAHSEEFGAIIANSLERLRKASKEENFDEKKNEVLIELERLLRGHNDLTSHFQKMLAYLSSIENDSERLSEELSRVTMLSLTDDLTGLPNRRAFIQRLRDEIARVQRYGNTLSLAIIDLDGFKPINDTYGHPVGDAVLNAYAKQVLTIFRRHDMVSRVGGEEFAIIFPYTESQGALQALKKVQNLAMHTSCDLERTSIPLPTFSAGLAVYHRGESVDSLIKRADSALYRAKDLGRNRIESV